jgi:hypothetical protein
MLYLYFGLCYIRFVSIFSRPEICQPKGQSCWYYLVVAPKLIKDSMKGTFGSFTAAAVVPAVADVLHSLESLLSLFFPSVANIFTVCSIHAVVGVSAVAGFLLLLASLLFLVLPPLLLSLLLLASLLWLATLLFLNNFCC